MSENASEQAKSRREFDPSIGKATQFQPGVCPNPGGRPKSKFISDRLRTALEEGDADVIADKLLTSAKAGEITAIKEVADRTEGKPQQSVKMSGSVAFDSLSDDELKEKMRQLLAELASE